MVSSAAEAEVGGVFHNAQVAIPIRTLLKALHHPQPPTPIKTDNSTAYSFIYNNIHQKRSKSWDMRYYWLRDRLAQLQFRFFGIKELIIMLITQLTIIPQNTTEVLDPDTSKIDKFVS